MSAVVNRAVCDLVAQRRYAPDEALAVIEFLEAVTEVLWAVHGEAIERRHHESEADGARYTDQCELEFEDDELPF